MASRFASSKQRAIFDKIAEAGELVFANGSNGVTANIVGEFYVKYLPEKGEDRLQVGDGTHHVHLKWENVTTVEHGTFHGEGMLTFKNNNGESLFRLYRMAGDFSDKIKELTGHLL